MSDTTLSHIYDPVFQFRRFSVTLKNKRPTWCHLLFYFTSYVLNMFRTLIYPSSGSCDYSVELPHWSYCSWFDVCWSFGVFGLEWYPCCRLKHYHNDARSNNYKISVTSSFSCRFSVLQDPYLTWIPISYLRIHHISLPYHFNETSILWKFFCVSFRCKRLKFSLLHHTSSDVKNEGCYISSHIYLHHVDR